MIVFLTSSQASCVTVWTKEPGRDSRQTLWRCRSPHRPRLHRHHHRLPWRRLPPPRLLTDARQVVLRRVRMARALAAGDVLLAQYRVDELIEGDVPVVVGVELLPHLLGSRGGVVGLQPYVIEAATLCDLPARHTFSKSASDTSKGHAARKELRSSSCVRLSAASGSKWAVAPCDRGCNSM